MKTQRKITVWEIKCDGQTNVSCCEASSKEEYDDLISCGYVATIESKEMDESDFDALPEFEGF